VSRKIRRLDFQAPQKQNLKSLEKSQNFDANIIFEQKYPKN